MLACLEINGSHIAQINGMCILNLIHANTSLSAPVSSRSAKVPKRHKISKAEMAQNVKLQLKIQPVSMKGHES